MQKRKFYLSPIKSMNFFPEALSKISPLSIDFMALLWSDKVSPIFLKFGQNVGKRLDFCFPKKLFKYIEKQKIYSRKPEVLKTEKLEKREFWCTSRMWLSLFCSTLYLNNFFGKQKSSLLPTFWQNFRKIGETLSLQKRAIKSTLRGEILDSASGEKFILFIRERYEFRFCMEHCVHTHSS